MTQVSKFLRVTEKVHLSNQKRNQTPNEKFVFHFPKSKKRSTSKCPANRDNPGKRSRTKTVGGADDVARNSKTSTTPQNIGTTNVAFEFVKVAASDCPKVRG